MTTIHKLGFGLVAAALVLGYAGCDSRDVILRGGTGGGTGGHPGAGGEPGVGGQPGIGGQPWGIGGELLDGTGGYFIYPSTGGAPPYPGTGGAPGAAGSPGTGGNPGAAGSPGTGGAYNGTYCAQLTTQADCDASTVCHSVFLDPGTCGCAVSGCCAHFAFCAASPIAQCKPVQLACAIATPHCEAPYLLAYRDSCYEGCVHQDDCAQ